MKRKVTLALCLLSLSAALRAEVHATGSATALVFGGATPGGRVVVCRIGNQRIDGLETILRQQTEVTATVDGNGTVAAGQPAVNAVWLVVDLTTGAYVVAMPPGFRGRAAAPPTIEGPGKASFVWSRPIADVYVVRPKVGTWHGLAAYGSATDGAHRADGRATFVMERLVGAADGPAPPLVFLPGDVLLITDPTWMMYAVAVVPKGGPGGN